MDYSWGQQTPQCVLVWMHGWPRWLGVIPGARPMTESRVYRGFLDSPLPWILKEVKLQFLVTFDTSILAALWCCPRIDPVPPLCCAFSK